MTTVAPRRPAAAVAAVPDSGPFVHGYLGYLLGQANHSLYRQFDVRVRAAGLRSIEWRVLATLIGRDPLSIRELAHEVLGKQPTVTKLVQRMVRQGWLEVQADAHDQRRTLVALTPSGRRLVRPLVRQAQAHEAALLGALTAREIAALKRLLWRIAAHNAGP